MDKIEVRKRTVFIFLTLVGLLAYANSFRVPFHYDDIHFLKEQVIIKSFRLFLDWLIAAPLQLIAGRAFLLFTFYLNYIVGGLDTFGYHLLNLAIHITASFLFYVILTRYVFRDEGDAYPWKSMLAATIFLLHPINTESVTYISSRSSELSTLFMLAAVLVFARSTSGVFRPGVFTFSIIFFILALTTKESAAVTPVLLLLFDRYFISHEEPWSRRRLVYHLPFFGILLAVSASFLIVFAHPEAYDRPWLTHILTEGKVFATFFRLFFIPTGLSIDHYIAESVSLDLPAAIAAALLAGLLLAAVFLRKRNKIISFAILWTMINLGPLMLLRLTDYMADRWAYAASLGFALGLVEVADLLTGKNKRKTALVVAVVAIVFGMMTISRNEVYGDPVKLWGDAVKKAPGKIRPYTNLAAAFMERGEVDRAIGIMEQTIKLGNQAPEVYFNLAMAYFLKDDLDRAEAVLLSVEGKVPPYVYYYNLGTIYKQKKDYLRAISMFKKSAAERRQAPAPLGLIGECYKLLGERKKAEEYFLSATRGIPQTGEDYLVIARSYFDLGMNENGRDSLNRALLADPLNIYLRNIIATSLLEGGQYDEAYKHYSFMAKISPRYAAAYIGMGRTLIGKGDKAAARTYFQKALEFLPPEFPDRRGVQDLLDRSRG